MSASYRPSWNPATPGRVEITYTVQNIGDVTVAARGGAEVSPAVGPGTSADLEVAAIAPGRSSTQTQVVDGVWPGLGTETVVRLEPYVPADPEIDLTAATITARTSGTVWPWQQVLALVLLAAAAAVAGVWAWRRRAGTAATTGGPTA